MPVTGGVSRREGNLGRLGYDFRAHLWTWPHLQMNFRVFLCFSSYHRGSHLPFGRRASHCFAKPSWRGKIIPAGQQLNKTVTGMVRDTCAGREAWTQSPAWSIPCLWGRQVGWLGSPERATSLSRKLWKLSLTQKSPQQGFLPACLLSPLLSESLDAVE